MLDWSHTHAKIGLLGRVRCEPGWRLDWHDPGYLKDFDLWFVWAGEGRMRLMDRTVALRPGICLWMQPGHTYIGDQDPTNRLGVTFIHFDLMSRNGRPIRRLPPEVHHVDDFTFFDSATRHIVGLMQDTRTPGKVARQLEAEALLRGLLIGLESGKKGAAQSLSPAQTEHHRKIREITSQLLENSGEPVSVNELARRTGYSPIHFARVFKNVTGLLPREFMIQARIARAKQLLRESPLSIGEISDALGYSDVFFFSRQFKERTGLSPTRFRAE